MFLGLKPRMFVRSLLLGVLAATAVHAPAHPGTGIVVDGKGQVFFVHGERGRIMKVDTAGYLSVLVERIAVPHHLVLHSDGFLYCAADSGELYRVSLAGEKTQHYPPKGQSTQEPIGVGGNPFTMDVKGNVYFAAARDRVLKLNTEGKVTALLPAADFSALHYGAMALGRDGSLYLSDNRSRIRRITPEGTLSAVAGGGEPGYLDGKGGQARFNYPAGLVVDASTNVYVADALNNRVRKIAADGMVSTVAGAGQEGTQNGDALTTTFSFPTGIALGLEGDIYVLETLPGDIPQVRRISRKGNVTTFATAK